MAEEQRHIDRLREEQVKAIEDTNQQIHKLEKFADDYKALQKRLTTLPDKLSHDVMVPFGKYAFMPGQIVHTNEVTVLLGDNWFCDQSAKQAAAIAGRRIDALKDQIKGLEKQKGLLEPRLAFTSELDNAFQEQQNIVEIKEEYDEEKETEWKDKHRRRMREHKQSTKAKSKTPVAKKPVAKKPVAKDPVPKQTVAMTTHTDEDVWRRLDELEQQETRNREMYRDFSVESTNKSKQPKASSQPTKRGVRWTDEEGSEESDSEDDEDDDDEDYSDEEDTEDEEEDSEEGEEPPVARPTSITFSHSPSSLSHDEAGSQAAAAAADPSLDLASPADVYDTLIRPVLDKPKSILKPGTRRDGEMEGQGVGKAPNTGVNPAHVVETLANQEEAFTGTVMEKPSTVTAEKTPETVTMDTAAMSKDSMNMTSHEEPPKRVSRFKARRMKSDGS